MINGQTRLVRSWLFFKKAQVMRSYEWVDVGSEYDVPDVLNMSDVIAFINDSDKSSCLLVVLSEVQSIAIKGCMVIISYKSGEDKHSIFSDKDGKSGDSRAECYFIELMNDLDCHIMVQLDL